MSTEPAMNKIRTSVLITAIFATIFAIIILFYRHSSRVSSTGFASSSSPLILIEASILTFIALLGSLLVILKMKYF